MHIHIHDLTSRKMVLWMSVLFMVGASCFMGAAVGFLLPNPDIPLLNRLYFIGSIPFTAAAFLQLLNASNQRGQIWKWFTFRSQNTGYPGALCQWLGTVLFNINTFDAILQTTWQQSDLLVWTPNLLGSMLFMLSAIYLLSDIHFTFDVHNNTHNSVWVNLLGCIAFLLSALTSIYLPSHLPEWLVTFAITNTLAGACCFFSASALTLTRLPNNIVR